MESLTHNTHLGVLQQTERFKLFRRSQNVHRSRMRARRHSISGENARKEATLASRVVDETALAAANLQATPRLSRTVDSGGQQNFAGSSINQPVGRSTSPPLAAQYASINKSVSVVTSVVEHPPVPKSLEPDEAEPSKGCCGKSKLSKRQIVSLIAMAMLNVLSNMVFSIMAPFFPQYVEAKGLLTNLQTGVVFAMFAVEQFLVAPVIGTKVLSLGPRRVLFLGELLNGGSTVAFGFLYLIEDPTTFLVLCLVIRGIQGVGCALSETASFSVVASDYQESTGVVVGILETAGGIGMVAGAPLGGFLFGVGGFRLPFLVTGCSLLGMLPILFLLIRSDKAILIEDEDEEDIAITKSKHSAFSTVIRTPLIWAMLGSTMFAFAVFAFLEPTLATALKEKYDLDETDIGLLFLASTGMYALLAPLAGYICDKTGPALPMISGYCLMALSYAFMGPFPPLGEAIHAGHSFWWLCLLSQLGLGIGGAFSLVPALPAMVDLMNDKLRLFEEEEQNDPYNVIAGMLRKSIRDGVIQDLKESAVVIDERTSLLGNRLDRQSMMSSDYNRAAAPKSPDLVSVCSAPPAIEQAKENGDSDRIQQRAEEVYSLLGGLLSSAMSLGSIIGPISGGSLVSALGFEWATGLVAAILAGYTVILIISFILVYRSNKRRMLSIKS